MATVTSTCHFLNAKLISFDIDHKEGVISVRFNQCDIDDFAFISGGKVEDLLFWDCGTIGSLFFGDVRISSVRIYSVKELNSIQVPFGAKIETLEIINSDIKNAEGERIFFPKAPPSSKVIGEVRLTIKGIKSLNIEYSNMGILDLSNASEDNTIKLANVKCSSMHISDFAKPTFILNYVEMLSEDASQSNILDLFLWKENTPRLLIESADFTSALIINCDFSIHKSVLNEVLLESAKVLNTNWPKKLEGSHSVNQSAFRQLKSLYQKQGNFRLQLDYHSLEMRSFKFAESERVKSINGVLNKLKERVDYFVKVFLPFHASCFGLLSWKPILWYFSFLLIAINAFILKQGETIGIKYTLAGNWDFSLFWHLFLPIHSKEFNGIQLNIGIDVMWRIIASFFIIPPDYF